MIRLEQVHFSFGQTEVIRGINLEVEAGATQVLLGLSGSGKTTCLKLMNGLLKPDSGEVFFNGTRLQDHDLLKVRRKMGYVIQEAGLFPHYSVFENVALVPHLLKWDRTKIRKRVEELLEKLHLDPARFAHKKPAQLSGGQQQRVGLARALAANPAALLMDEAFGALDPITRVKIRKEFLSLEELREKTIVMVTHDVQEAFEMGDKIALFHEGRIIQNAPPESILKHPANTFVKDFIEADLLSLSLKQSGLYDELNEELKQGKLDLNKLRKP